jgi:hypothetical protein
MMKRVADAGYRRAISALIVCLGLGAFTAAHAAEVEPPLGSSRGPVLCIWSITVTQIAVAEKCHKGSNVEFVDTLKWSLGQMDAFIKRNSITTQAELDGRRIKLTEEVAKKIQLDAKGECVPGQPMLVFYPKQMPKRQEVVTATTKLLEFNRRPEMGACI